MVTKKLSNYVKINIVNDKKIVKGGKNNMDNYNEVVGFNKERELENLHNGKNIEDICYDIIEYANEFEVLDAAMTLLDGVIDWMALNIENENEIKDAEKLKTAFNLMDEVKKSYYKEEKNDKN